MHYLVEVVLYFVGFAAAMYGLGSLDFKKIVRNYRSAQAQVLLIITAMALSYLMVQFLKQLLYIRS